MKNGMVVVAALALFCVIPMHTAAEMRITPDGVTTPDDAASVRMSGSFNTGSLTNDGPQGGVISGENSDTSGYLSYGGYFTASGGSGTGVYGYAQNNGDYTNYGGYFLAKGGYGRGVFGRATGANSTAVWGEGVNWDFYANGSGTNYGPFTGAHEVKFAQGMPEAIVPGLIVSVTGKAETRKDKNGNISLSSTLPTVTLSTTARDKTVFGVLVSQSPLPEGHWYPCEESERFGVVNALGEGRVWVTDINGQIQAGDYITTSSIPDYGQMQDDDLLRSYTLGKAISTIDWDQVMDTVQHDGKIYRRYLMAVVYTSG